MKLSKIVIMFCTLLVFYVNQGLAQEWSFAGLANHRILSLLHHNNLLMVGTDKGLFLQYYPDPKWYPVPLANTPDLPIQDIICTNTGNIIIAAGNNSLDDAIFTGDYIWPGPPYWATIFIDRFPQVQSLAATRHRSFGDSIDGLVYAGGGNNLKKSVWKGGKTYGELDTLVTPANCFGTINPYCAAMICWTFENTLFAGGYDLAPEGGPGHLVWQNNQNINILKKLNVSAITQEEYEIGIMENKIYFATRDSGIYITQINSSRPPYFFRHSPNQEPITDIIMLPLYSSFIGPFFVATENNIYTPGSGVPWIKLGSIPEKPTCLVAVPAKSRKNDSLLYAGTENGLYKFDFFSTQLHNTFDPPKFSSPDLLNSHGSFSLEILQSKTGPVKIDIFDCQGTLIKQVMNTILAKGTHRIVLATDLDIKTQSANGIYLIRVKTYECVFVRKFYM